VHVADALDALLPELQRVERRVEEDQHSAKEPSDKRPVSLPLTFLPIFHNDHTLYLFSYWQYRRTMMDSILRVS
jgi:hypothetical protein